MTGRVFPSRLTLMLYPFAAGAAAINIFMASLLASWIGFTVLTPVAALGLGMIGGAPLAVVFSRYIKRLQREADGDSV